MPLLNKIPYIITILQLRLDRYRGAVSGAAGLPATRFAARLSPRFVNLRYRAVRVLMRSVFRFCCTPFTFFIRGGESFAHAGVVSPGGVVLCSVIGCILRHQVFSCRRMWVAVKVLVDLFIVGALHIFTAVHGLRRVVLWCPLLLVFSAHKFLF